MENSMPSGRNGARQRRAAGLGARGFVAARVMGINGDVAVPVGTAGNKAVGVISESLTARICNRNSCNI